MFCSFFLRFFLLTHLYWSNSAMWTSPCVFQGILTVKAEVCQSSELLSALFHHECCRAIADRFVDGGDRRAFGSIVETVCALWHHHCDPQSQLTEHKEHHLLLVLAKTDFHFYSQINDQNVKYFVLLQMICYQRSFARVTVQNNLYLSDIRLLLRNKISSCMNGIVTSLLRFCRLSCCVCVSCLCVFVTLCVLCLSSFCVSAFTSCRCVFPPLIVSTWLCQSCVLLPASVFLVWFMSKTLSV